MKKLFFLIVAIALFATNGNLQANNNDIDTTTNPTDSLQINENYIDNDTTIAEEYGKLTEDDNSFEDNTLPDDDRKYFDPEIARDYGDEMTPIPSPNDILGIPLWNKDSLLSLFVLFFVNILICWLIVHFLYYRKSKRKDYYFTFMLFGTTVFLLMNLLNNVNLAMGFAMGLFAIFGLIRYRTEPLPIREMTYLFVIIGISVINGLAMSHGYINLLVVNLLFIIVILIFDGNKAIKHVATKIVLYERIELVKHGREDELIADLKERTGLDIQRIEVGHIDFLRDVAYIKIYYTPISDQINSIDTIVKHKDFMK